VRKTDKNKFLAVDGDFGKGPCDLSDLVHHNFVCRLSFVQIELSQFAQECWGLGDLPRIQQFCKLNVSIGMYFEFICDEPGFRMRVSVPCDVQHHACKFHGVFKRCGMHPLPSLTLISRMILISWLASVTLQAYGFG